MKKLLAITILLMGTMFLISCGGDDDEHIVEYDAQIIRIGNFDRIEANGTGSIPMTITLDTDLTSDATWNLTFEGVTSASIGGATSGSTGSGTVTVEITAGSSTDNASVTLEVTNPSQDTTRGSAQATANFNVD